MRPLRTLTLVIGLCLLTAIPVIADEPGLRVSAPTSNAVVRGSSVTVVFETGGITLTPSPVPVELAGAQPEANRVGEGHLHLTLDLQPLVIVASGEPYTFTNVPPGPHQLTVELVNNDHSPLDPRIVRVSRFRTLPGVARAGAPPHLPRGGALDDLPFDLPIAAHTLLVMAAAVAISIAGVALNRR